MNAVTDDRIFNLWATMFLHHVPEDPERHREALATFARETPGTGLLEGGGRAADWLRSKIEEAATAYLQRYAEMRDFTLVTRTLVHDHGDYQPLKNHPDAYLSGIFSVKIPKGHRETAHRYDVDSNAISFYDPRFGMNMGAIAKDPNADMEKQIRLQPGMLLMWPSFVDYFLHPNLSADPAIFVQFNIVLSEKS